MTNTDEKVGYGKELKVQWDWLPPVAWLEVKKAVLKKSTCTHT